MEKAKYSAVRRKSAQKIAWQIVRVMEKNWGALERVGIRCVGWSGKAKQRAGAGNSARKNRAGLSPDRGRTAAFTDIIC